VKDFSHAAPAPVAVVVDLGGTRVRAALAARDGVPWGRAERATDRRGPAAFVDRAAGLVDEVLAIASETRPADPRLPVIVGVTGPVDPDGRLVDPPNLEPAFRGFALRAALEVALERPVLVGLDTHLALLGEQASGALRGVDDALYLTFSTGVGGALLADGRLIRGALGMAGEVGHLPVSATGPRCGCGERGHLEAWASGPAIAGAATRRAARRPGSALAARLAALGRPPTGADVATWSAAGDADAAAVLDAARRAAAVGVAALVAVLDPATVVLGGGVVLGDPAAWVGACRRHLDRKGLQAHRGRVRIVSAMLGDEAALHGGVAYARLVRPELLAAPGEVG
jgi:glucokinase